MPQILLTWLLFSALSLFLGAQLEKLAKRFFPETGPVSLWLLLWSGMALLYFLLSIITFFAPLNHLVKPILWAFLSVWMVQERRFFQAIANRIFRIFQSFHPLAWLLFLLTGIIGLLKAVGMPEIFDEGAYHLPLIRMWEEKGIVPGFANLNAHYGLHSGWHLLSAFSNLNFLPGFVSDMSLNGLMAALLGLFSASRLELILKGKGIRIAWILAVFLPFFLFRNLLSSPSTDVPAIIGTWFFFLLWMEQAELKERDSGSLAFLFMLPVFLTVLKASSAGILVASAGFLFVSRKKKSLWFLLIPYGLIFGVWMLQNWLISGYLFFPMEFSAFGNPDWLVPVESMQKKFYSEQFGAFAPPESYHFSWLKSWFSAHNPDSKLIILLSAGFFLLAPLLTLFHNVLRQRTFAAIYLMLFLLTGIWFFTITEPRYGFGALVMAALFIPAFFLRFFAEKKPLLRFVPLLILPLLMLNGWKTFRELQQQVTGNKFLKPAPVPSVAFRYLHCGNFLATCPQVYKSPVPAGKPVFCWDCPFPCFPLEGIEDSAFVFEYKMAWFTGYSFRKTPNPINKSSP